MKYCHLQQNEWTLVKKSENYKYHMTYMWHLKNNTSECIYKTETYSQMQKANLELPQGRRKWERQIRGRRLTNTSYYKQTDNQQDILYSTWDYIQYLIITYNGIYSEKTKSLCCTPQSSTIYKINYTSTTTKKKALIGFTKINLFNFEKNQKKYFKCP